MTEAYLSDKNSPVLAYTLPTADGQRIAVAVLNQPQRLNACNAVMTQALWHYLQQWSQTPDVVAVVLMGNGERAFCAGGDLHSLYHSMPATPLAHPWDNTDAYAFFQQEYALNYRMHTYKKPLIVLGQGIVMGGGMGLLMGGSHRVVNDSTRMAMPEVAIGLFPDVAASWVFGHLPGHAGRFLAITGEHFTAADALFLGLANAYVPGEQLAHLPYALAQLSWGEDAQRHHDVASAFFAQWDWPQLIGSVQQHLPLLQRLGQTHDPVLYAQKVAALHTHDDAWLRSAAQRLRAGSPLSVMLTQALLHTNRHASLAQALSLEFNAALYACYLGELKEGIRALLIDKDKSPQWQYSDWAQVPSELLVAFVQSHQGENQPHPVQALLNGLI